MSRCSSAAGFEAMLEAYVEAALFSSSDEDGTPLDRKHGPSSIAAKTRRSMEADVCGFLEAHRELIGTRYKDAGHDLWLTRNRHGAGFWDGDWPEAAGRELTKAAHATGGRDLYVSRGKIHQTPEAPFFEPPSRSSSSKGPRARLSSGYAYELEGSAARWRSSSDEKWEQSVVDAHEGELLGERRIDGSRVLVVRVGDRVYAQLPHGVTKLGDDPLPKYSATKGWHGGDSRTLYAFTDRRTGAVSVEPGGGSFRGRGPELNVAIATREQATRHWQSPLDRRWKVRG